MKQETIKDPFSYKFIHWNAGTIIRANNCGICGVNSQFSPTEMHHVKHRVKDKTNNFSQVWRQINRKQISVGRECYKSIHNGTYLKIKLSDFTFSHYGDMEK